MSNGMPIKHLPTEADREAWKAYYKTVHGSPHCHQIEAMALCCHRFVPVAKRPCDTCSYCRPAPKPKPKESGKMGYKKSQKTVQTVSHEIEMTGKELREMIQDKMPEARLPDQFLLRSRKPGPDYSSSYEDTAAINDSRLLTITWTDTEKVGEE